MKQLDAKSESVRNQREMLKTQFEAVDARANEAMQRLVQLIKTLNEIRGAPTKSVP